MNRNLFIMTLVLSILSGFLIISTAVSEDFSRQSLQTDLKKSVESLTMFQAKKFDAHYRTPNIEQIELLLQEQGIPLEGTLSAEEKIQTFKREWAKRNPTTVNPQKLRKLLEKERRGPIALMAIDAPITQFKSLVVPVEFLGTDTFDQCGITVTTSGPLHNEIAQPGARDNNTVWYDNTSPTLYNELYFGVGPTAGVVVNHPNLGAVDLRGNTMANYYLEQSGGMFTPTGQIYPNWLQAAHSEGWYGADACTGGGHNVRAHDLVREVVDLIKADNPNFAWQDFDADGDGIVDNFTVIHAGAGQEGGGGVQGAFAIWSHASLLNYPTGYLACTAGSTGCPARNIYVREYSMDPENIDVGVISEEFGHAAFGLPDIYATDTQASPSNWAIFESGSWNGPLGGMQPAPFPLWARALIGWSTPAEVNYDTGPVSFKVGQHSLPPKKTQSGIKINLPDQAVVIDNKIGTGIGWWSDKGNLLNQTLTHSFNLASATAPVFSFASYWSIEEDWDYGYVEVSTNAGVDWTILPDMYGILRNTNPNGSNQGWGLTGEGSGTLYFNLAAYAGQQIDLRLRYSTDMSSYLDGWWVDTFYITDGATTLFYDTVESGANGWTADGWSFVPQTQYYPIYYLAEWRNDSGFDRGLKYPYQSVYNNESTNEWEVDRCAYSVPGMLLWLRNSLHSFDYTLGDSFYVGPSYGPKHALLVIDSHYWPMAWSDWVYSDSGAPYRISNRCQPADSVFSLTNTIPFTIRFGSGTDILETKTFTAKPGVSQFHDSLGYYPGLWFRPSDSYFWFWQREASAVIPSLNSYTTSLTDIDKSPYTDLYGETICWVTDGCTILGTGNPGDSDVQYGLHIAVAKQDKKGRWGQIAVWNSQTLNTLNVIADKSSVAPGDDIKYTLVVTNNSPVKQVFTVRSPIPVNTTLKSGKGYDAGSNSIVWTGIVNPGKSKKGKFSVTISPFTAPGTIIGNISTLTDDALGGTASVNVMVQ